MPSELTYSQGGARKAPTLLLIHPMGTDHGFWDSCRAIWEKDFHCIAPDLRNAGASPRDDRAISIEEHAGDIEAFCRMHDLGSVVTVGCAVGAMIAVVHAGIFLQRSAALILSNPGYRTRPEAHTALEARAREVRVRGLNAVVDAVMAGAFLGCDPDASQESFRQRFVDQDSFSYALQIEGVLDADTSAHLAHVACPTLIVAGGNDRLLPPDHAHAIRDTLTDAEYVLVEEGAHFIPYQRPQEFAGLVYDFLKRRLSAA